MSAPRPSHDSALVSGILDVYAEESTQRDYDRGRSVWIESKSNGIVKAGEECLRNVGMEDRVAYITRRMGKLGDAFQRLIYQTGKGVLAWRQAPATKVHRVEDKFARLTGFREDGQKYRGKKRTTSWPWDYIHFRLLGKYEEAGYGTSLLESMFRPWRQMTLAEDSVLMYRMRRAPDRNLVLVDVGNMEEHEAIQYLNSWRKRFRKWEFVDPASPNYKKQYNPLTPTEDVFVAMRRDNTTRIESLSGAGNMGELYDLEHFRNKFFGSAKVPKAYFGFEGDINAKATLLQQDVRFARSCKAPAPCAAVNSPWSPRTSADSCRRASSLGTTSGSRWATRTSPTPCSSREWSSRWSRGTTTTRPTSPSS